MSPVASAGIGASPGTHRPGNRPARRARSLRVSSPGSTAPSLFAARCKRSQRSADETGQLPSWSTAALTALRHVSAADSPSWSASASRSASTSDQTARSRSTRASLRAALAASSRALLGACFGGIFDTRRRLQRVALSGSGCPPSRSPSQGSNPTEAAPARLAEVRLNRRDRLQVVTNCQRLSRRLAARGPQDQADRRGMRERTLPF